jgi:hypothetical protein
VDLHAYESFRGIEPFEQRLTQRKNVDGSPLAPTAKELENARQMQADKEASLKIAETKVRSGFIAQEVQEAALASGYDFDGVNLPQHDKDSYSLAYSQFVMPLVKAVQEQQQIIENGERRMEDLERENMALKAQLDKITAALAGMGIAVEK